MSSLARRNRGFILQMLWNLWKGLFLLLCVVVLFCILLFTKLPDYRTEIELGISQFLGQSLTIGKLSTYWENGALVLMIAKVRVSDVDYDIIERAEIKLNVLESLKNRQLLTSHFSLKSQKIKLTKQADGRIILTDFPNLKKQDSNSDNQAFFVWLLQQPFISIAIDTFKLSELEKPDLILNGMQVDIQKDLINHKIKAKIDIENTPYSQDGHLSLNGVIYWKKRDFISAQTEFTIDELNLVSPDKIIAFQQLKGDIAINKVGDKKWHLDIKPLIININSATSTQHHVDMTFEQNTENLEWRGTVDSLPADGILPWVFSTILKKSTQATGIIENFQWHYSGQRGFVSASCDLQITDFKAKDFARIEQVQNLQGKLYVELKKGSLDFKNATVTYRDEKFYSHTLTVEQGQGQLDWQLSDSNILLFFNNMQAFFKKMSLEVQGTMDFTKVGSLLQTDLELIAKNGLLLDSYQLIPDNRLGKVADYLKKSLLSGKVKTVTLSVHGSPENLFKIDKGFDLKADIDNAHVDYKAGWPPVFDADGTVSIEGTQLKIDIKRGKMLNSNIQGSIVKIDDMMAKEILLEVEGRAKVKTADLIEFIEQSPLNQKINFGKKDLSLKGNTDLYFDLNFPFSKGKNKIELKIDFKNNEIRENHLGTVLTKAQGSLNFKNNVLSSQKLSGDLFGQRVNLDLKTNDQGAKILFSGNADRELISKELIHLNPFFKKIPIYDNLSGKTAWTAALDIRGSHINFTLSSDFRGLKVDFPQPLNKTLEDWRKFDVIVRVSKNVPTIIELYYDKMVSAIFELSKQGLQRAGVSFERPQAHLPDIHLLKKARPVVDIEGMLWNFSSKAWFEALSKSFKTDEEPFKGLINFNLHFKHLELLNQDFQNTILRAQYQNGELLSALSGKNIDGHIAFKDKKFDIKFKHLYFDKPKTNDKPSSTPAEKPATKTNIDPKSLPALNLLCESLKIGDIDVGRIELQSAIDNKGLNLKKINLHNSDLTLAMRGRWDAKDSSHRTSFQAQLAVENTEKLIHRLGYEKSPIKDGKTELAIDLNWQNAPHLLELKALVGKVFLSITEGQILDVDPGVFGRIFGLFNISVLPRRLALDFKDVFGDGFRFFNIEGNFTINDGKAYTDDLLIEGVPAQVKIQGGADFVNKRLDQTVSVIPDLTNTIPVAGALASGLGVGALILVLQKLWKTEIEEIVNFQYHISGNWDNPKITPIPSSKEEDNTEGDIQSDE